MKMKKTLAGALLLLAACAPLQLQAQCSVNVTTPDSVICNGDSITLTAVIPLNAGLTTTMAAGNNHRGNMFDLVALNTVTITQFDGHPMGNTNVAVYYKTGSYVGFENNTAAWTLLGTASIIAQPYGTPTPYPIPVNITIPAGQTYAFYVTSTNVAVAQNYTDGSFVGNVYASNSDFQFLEGCGLEYPFSGSPFTPRIWNGVIHYHAGTTYLWNTGATTSAITVAPHTTTPYSVDVNIVGCPATVSDSITIAVNSSVVDLGPDQSVCEDGQVDLDAGAGFVAYNWSVSATTQTISVDASTLPLGVQDISIGVFDLNGCFAYDTVAVTIVALPAPDLGNDQTVCGDVTVLLDGGAGFASYTWSTSDTTQTISINTSSLTPGAHTYFVTVGTAEDCMGTDTVTINVISCAGIESTLGSAQVNLYPNPATEQVFISINATEIENASLVIYDDLGKAVMNMTGLSGTTGITVPVSTLAPGIYLVRIELDGQLVWKKMIKA